MPGQTYADRLAREPWRALYATRRWQRLRRDFLHVHPLCECENCRGVRPILATVVDHRRPHRGDEALFFDWDNLCAMAKRCHDAKTAREVNERRRQQGGLRNV